MAKLRLLTEEDSFFEPYILGINSALPDHRLAYKVNSVMGLNLCRTEKEHEVHHRSQVEEFPLYSHFDEAFEHWWHLVPNRGLPRVKHELNSLDLFAQPVTVVPWLLKSRKDIDVFLICDAALSKSEGERLMKELLNIPEILSIRELNWNELKEKNHLIIETPLA